MSSPIVYVGLSVVLIGVLTMLLISLEFDFDGESIFVKLGVFAVVYFIGLFLMSFIQKILHDGLLLPSLVVLLSTFAFYQYDRKIKRLF